MSEDLQQVRVFLNLCWLKKYILKHILSYWTKGVNGPLASRSGSLNLETHTISIIYYDTSNKEQKPVSRSIYGTFYTFTIKKVT